MTSNLGAGTLFGAAIVAMMAGPAVAAEGVHMRSIGEGLEFGASLSVAQTTSDNFYYQPDNETEVEGLLISPALTLKQNFVRSSAVLNANAQIANFDVTGGDSDYSDFAVTGRFSYDGGLRNAFGLDFGAYHGHDPFGVDRTAGSDPNVERVLDEWDLNRVRGNYRYGAQSALFNVELEAEHATKDYTTNESATAFLNYNKTSLAQLLVLNVSPKTSAFVEFGEDMVSFDERGSVDRDAQELRVRAGLRWKASAKTTGDIRVGATRRTLDDSDVRVLDGASWRGVLTWAPVARSTFTLETSRSSQEPVTQLVQVIDNRRGSLTYSQGWTKSFRTVISYGTANSKFVGNGREDDLKNLGLSAIYSFRSMLSLYADVLRSERDSSSDTLDFTSTSAVIGIRVSP